MMISLSSSTTDSLFAMWYVRELSVSYMAIIGIIGVILNLLLLRAVYRRFDTVIGRIFQFNEMNYICIFYSILIP